MIRYRLKVRKYDPARVVVSLAATDILEIADLSFEGDPEDPTKVQDVVARSSNAFGQGVGLRTTPADLSYAMRSSLLDNYEPELIEGGEILSSSRK